MSNRMRNVLTMYNKLRISIPFYIAVIFILLTFVLEARSEKEKRPFVVICPATGMVDDGMKVIIKRAVSIANKGAEGFILEVDTPGGLVDSAVDITNILLEARCPTVAYIHGMGAISAGALISYACKYIVMAPGSNIGASAPIVMGEAQPSEEFNEKTKSYLRSRYRSLAEVNRHDPLLAEAMVDSKIEVWGIRTPENTFQFFRSEEEAKSALQKYNRNNNSEDKSQTQRLPNQDDLVKLPNPFVFASYEYLNSNMGQRYNIVNTNNDSQESQYTSSPIVKKICREGELLTLTSKEALDYGLACTTVGNIEELLRYFHWENCEKIQIEPTWGERVFKFLVNPIVAGLLLLLGIGGLYMEMKTPGFGLPGTIGLICLALFFGAHLVIGLANWADLLLLLTGLILLGIEIFLIPGFGLTGIAGLTCIMIGIYLSLTRVVVPEYPWDFERLDKAGQTLTIALISFLILAWLLWKYLPNSVYFQRVMLSHAENVETGYVVQSANDIQKWIGSVGIAETVLRPAGKGRFQGTSLDVVSVGDYIEAGTKIRIVEVHGNRYVVIPEKEDKEVNS
ncbi:MAG: NfeD family protein [Candidatus Hydrogenedens sp.]